MLATCWTSLSQTSIPRCWRTNQILLTLASQIISWWRPYSTSATQSPSFAIIRFATKIVDPVVFSAALRLKPVCTTPSDDASLFADQLNQSITDVLDELAPLKSGSKRGGKRSSRWLSDAAIASK